MRGVRDLARKRMQLVQQRTTQILSIKTCFDQQTGAHISINHTKDLANNIRLTHPLIDYFCR
jgi:hypothetical protein